MKKVCSVLAAFCMVLTLMGAAFVPGNAAQAAQGGRGIPDYVSENGQGVWNDEIQSMATRNANAALMQELEGGPSVETLNGWTCFFANGTPITVSEGEEGIYSVLISWDGGEYLAADGSRLYIFGGSHNSDEVVESSNITVNGGLIHILSAGGLHKSHTVNSTVTINGGQITNLYAGSIGFGHGIDSCPTTQDHQNECVLEHAAVNVNGGVLQAIYGGGMAYQAAEETRIELNAGEVQQFLLIAGANGTSGDMYVHVTGDMYVNTVYGAARGTVDSLNFSMDGGRVDDLFVGTDGYLEDNADVEYINASVTGGKVGKLEEVYFGTDQVATEEEVEKKTDLEFYESAVGNLPEMLSGFVANVSFHIGEETYKVAVTKGKTVDAYKLDANPGYVLDGWYVDNAYTQKWDFASTVTEDMALYGKWKESNISTAVLEYALKLAKETDKTGVLESVVEKLDAAIARGEEILAKAAAGDPTITQEMVDESWQEIVTLMQYLSFKQGDKTDLGKIIAFAKTIDLKDFLEIGQKEFDDALLKAQTVYDDGNAMQPEVDEAGKALLKALSELRRKPDKDALEKLLGQAESLSEKDYEPAGFGVLRAAIAQAETAYENAQATKEEVTAAEDGLKNAMAKLVPVSTRTKEEKTDTLLADASKTVANAASGNKETTSTVNSNAKKNAEKSVKTGDGAVAVLPAGTAMMALAAMAMVMKRRKMK